MLSQKTITRLYQIFIVFFISGCIGYQPQPSLKNLSIVHNTGKLQCGIAKVNFTPYKKTAMAPSYGIGQRTATKTFHDHKRGITHDCFVRSAVFSNGGEIAPGKRYLAYVALDLLIVTDELKKRIEDRIASDIAVVLCATHSHSSIGGYWEGCIPELGMGSYDEENLNHIAQRTARSIRLARGKMQAAKIGFSKGNLDGITKNRRHKNDPVDTSVHIIHIASLKDNPIADLVWFAGHPTMFASDLYEFSGDFPGVFSRKLEKQYDNYVAMFFQGGVADVRPSLPSHLRYKSKNRVQRKVGNIENVGTAIANYCLEKTKDIVMNDQIFISHSSPKFVLGKVNVNAVPDILIPLEIIARIWIEIGYMPAKSNLALTRLHNGAQDVIIANFPFELSSTLTIDLRKDMEKNYDIGIVTSLANGWYSYLLHWPSALWPPWGPEYFESFFDAGYAECIMKYGAKISQKMYTVRPNLGQ